MISTNGEMKTGVRSSKEFRPTRRRVLQSGAALAALSQITLANSSGSVPTGFGKQMFLIDRITFGLDRTMYDEYQALGYTGFLNWQLDPGGTGHDLAHESQVQADLRAITYKKPIWALNSTKYNGYNPFEMFYVKDRSPWHTFFQFNSATFGLDCARLSITDIVYQSANSRYQLFHVMNDFWMNVFNIYSQQKSLWAFYLHTLDTAIRPSALGKFGDLLLAVTRSPAMMIYLDQHTSEKTAPNENFARELLELHTVGEGNFSEADVREVAKVLTGWSIHTNPAGAGQQYEWIINCIGEGAECDNVVQPNMSGLLKRVHIGSAVYKKDDHTPGTKTVLGTTYGSTSTPSPLPPDFGLDEGEQLIQDLALHPQTADTLVRRLIKWFFYDDTPPASLINRVTNAYLSSGGGIKETLIALFDESHLDEVFCGPGAKVRRPLNKLVWTMRTLQPEFLQGSSVRPDWINMLVLAGQIPTGWPSPDGHPGENEFWTGAIHPRLDMANRIAFNDGTALDLTTSRLNEIFGSYQPADYAFWANVFFFLGRLPVAEVQGVKAHIIDLVSSSTTYTDEQLQRETVAMIGSLPSAQFFF